jgi:carboxymethylenebutenolidase
MGEMVEFPSNGATGGGYLAPASEGAGLGVIVVQEWWGLVDHIVDVCDRFAAEGFTALAPDLYHGKTVPNREPDEAAKAMMALDLERAARDLSGAVDFLQAHDAVRGHGVAVVGFCMGGGLAL